MISRVFTRSNLASQEIVSATRIQTAVTTALCMAYNGIEWHLNKITLKLIK